MFKKLTYQTQPTFLIIGAQKCGTTALYHYLCQHPEILPPSEKEIDYFWLDHLYGKGTDWYLSHFPRPYFFYKNKSITFEASPHYLFHPEAAKRIYDFNPAMKITILLRNPIDRAFAQFQMYQRKRKSLQQLDNSIAKHKAVVQQFFMQLKEAAFFNNFDAAVAIELAMLKQHKQSVPYLLEQGLYAEQIANYLQYFPREQVLILQTEKMLSHSQAILDETTTFLGCQKFTWPKDQLKKQNEGNYSEKINPKTYLALKAFFEEPNYTLYQLIGQDFGW